MSHYIWNRAERVAEKNMPHILTKCFGAWSKERYARLKLTSDEKKRKSMLKTIVKQRRNYEDALRIFRIQHNSTHTSANQPPPN
jgi:hypothetical protein